LENPAETQWRDSIYYHYYEHGGEHQVPRHEGVRTERYKLINFYSNDGLNLFDLKTDPMEMHDVSGDPAYAATLDSMKAELQRQRKHYELPALRSVMPTH
jgi:N-acetylglucosamine-6-sulfatase